MKVYSLSLLSSSIRRSDLPQLCQVDNEVSSPLLHIPIRASDRQNAKVLEIVQWEEADCSRSEPSGSGPVLDHESQPQRSSVAMMMMMLMMVGCFCICRVLGACRGFLSNISLGWPNISAAEDLVSDNATDSIYCSIP